MTLRSKRAWRNAGWFGALHFVVASALTALMYALTGHIDLILYCCFWFDIFGLQFWQLTRRVIVFFFGVSVAELLNSNWWLMIGILGFSTLQWAAFGWLYGYYSYRAHSGILCTYCEYNLTGNTSGVCPECGKVVVNTPSD